MKTVIEIKMIVSGLLIASSRNTIYPFKSLSRKTDMTADE